MDDINLTQVAMQTPDNYLDGNDDYWEAHAFALKAGFPRRSISTLENNVLSIIWDDGGSHRVRADGVAREGGQVRAPGPDGLEHHCGSPGS